MTNAHKHTLISVDESDLVDGVFYNDKVTEVADRCFYNMPSLKKVVLPRVTVVGGYWTETKS